MRVRTLTLATAALSAALLTTACRKSNEPAPGTAPAGSQPTAASAPTGTTATVPPPSGTPTTQPPAAPTPVSPATTPADAPVTPGTTAAAPATAPISSNPVPARPVAPAAIVVPAGTRVTIRTNQSLSGEHDDVGTPFTGSLNYPVVVRGATAFPRGTEVHGEIVSAKGRGRFKGAGYLGIALTSIGGYRVSTSEYSVRHKGRGKRTAGFIGGGGGVGALIGGLAGGGKGALIGGLTGAGAGTAAGALTGSRDVVIPAESAVSFTTRNSISVRR